MKKKTESNEHYFAEKQEQAVIDYIRSDSQEDKNRIYNEFLLVPFTKMIQSILRKYPIHIGNYDMAEVESNALTHLIDQMVKYNPDTITKSGEKTKAYSYCQTIIRNYYKDHSKKSYTEKKINLPYDDFAEDINENPEFSYEIEIEHQHYLERLINTVINKIECKIEGGCPMKKNEVIVGDAIINVLKNWHVLFLEDSPEGKYNKRVTNKFAKNKILLFLKEQTGLIVQIINFFDKIYLFKV